MKNFWQNRGDLAEENNGDGGEKLDLPVHNEIHRSKSTKSPQIKRIEEIWVWLFLWGFWKLGQNKTKLARNRRGRLQIREKPWLLIPIWYGARPSASMFQELEVDLWLNTKNTKRKSQEGNTQEWSMITHPLDSPEYMRYRVHNQQKDTSNDSLLAPKEEALNPVGSFLRGALASLGCSLNGG